MNSEYITRSEFQQHEINMNNRFDAINDKISLTKDVLSEDIKNAVSELKNEISNHKVTSKRFWIGISIPTILSLLSMIITILVALLL
ncbi:hypothetical protein MUA77_05415 [Mammaliicoccus sciuri]|uniref:hypothetical protein n=2 Tax=Mammaliicoccus sciuri TaxID=1296 RepID=UPI0021D084F2|nr:hypothetical protein [Mammaliicoccus sciuri]UXU84829.1 hypothetical protein MUA77_05415 [Mammaliicoccus sciuri]UXU94676.1 hypothetical protein MUA42_05425 [Mammaliicoccus sciuri]UXV24885.1 hypothetical protein MUA49_05420 [Mammaliicoccus sciuri]UXV27670.1 hypothetical protein MUA96_05420 [Mammaliicoccus sciuri]